MKKILLTMALAVAVLIGKAQTTSVALADAHWGFEAGEATTYVGQYNSKDYYVPAGWTSSNGYQSASTQYKPYIVTNGTNIYASEGTQALHIEGTSTYNLPYVILPAITGVDNYNALTLVFKVRPGYWSDFGGGEGMWSKCGSSDCRTIKVGHLAEIPDRENFATSVTNIWDTTFNAAGFFDPETANPFCEVRIPMAGCGQYMAIYCEANANCYFCIDEVSIEGGEPAPAEPYTVTLANAVWNFSDMNYYELPTYKRGQIQGNSAYGFVPANWCVDNENKRKTVRGSSAYIPFICPNSSAIATNTTQFGMDGDLGLKFYHNPSNYKEFAILPRITNAAYTNLELEFYARKGVTSTETDYDSKLSIGYLIINDWASDTLNVIDNVVNIQNLDVVNGTESNGYTKYTISLETVPANGRVVFYDATNANNIVYLDNISIKEKTSVTPEPQPEPQPLTKEALADSINWWVASVAHAGTTARATFVLHFQNGNIAYGYEWDGSAISAMDAMDEIVASDPDLAASKMANGQYYTSFTYGELSDTQSWGWGVSKNDAGSFAAHNALTIANEDMIIFSYNDMSVPQLAALTDNIEFVEEKEAPAPTYSIVYSLTGCTADAENPTELTEEDDQISLDFALADGFTWAGAEISVTMGEEEIIEDWDADNWYYWTVSEGNLYIYLFDGVTADLNVTITAKPAIAFPTEFAAAQFEDVTVGENGVYYNPALANGINEWLDGSFLFATYFDDSYGTYYSDVVVSSLVDPTMTADYSNPVSYLSAAVDHAAQGNNFAVWNQNFYGINPVKLGAAQTVSGMAVTNTSAVVNYIFDEYTAFGQDAWFKLIVTGKKAGEAVGTAEFYLVDFRTEGEWKYAENWQWLDLSALGEVDELMFDVDGSDKNDWGLLSPAYFCFDNLGGKASDCQLGEMTVVRENNRPTEFAAANFEELEVGTNGVYRPESFVVGNNEWLSGSFVFNTSVQDWGDYGMGYTDIQVVNFANGNMSSDFSDAYLATAAQGAAEGNNYAVWNDAYGANAQIEVCVADTVSGMAVTNIKHAVTAITEGMAPARKFEQGDWLKITATGWKDGETTGETEFYLADFRGETEWVYAENWQWMDLSVLGAVDHISFSISSSDNGDWGMNTPAYFCFDNLGGQAADCQLGEMTVIKIVEDALEQIDAKKAEKTFENGHIYIKKGGKVYDAAGMLVK